MEEDIAIIGHNEEESTTESTTTGTGSHFNNLQLSFTSHEKDGSLHALQTAYSEVKKRLQEQVNKNAILQTSIREMEMQRISSGRPNSGVFGAAGPPCEPEQDLQAQYRAEFGFAQSLERQVIRAKSTLSKLESENKHLNKKLTQIEEELKQFRAREIEKTKEIERLREELHSQSSENLALKQEVERLQSLLQKRSDDVLRLQNLVQNPDRSMLQTQLQTQLQQRDEEIQSLTQRLKGLESGLPSLNSISFEEEKRILDQVERYSKTIKTLKAQVQDQGKMLVRQQEAIRKLIDNSRCSSLGSTTSRYAAEGSSFVSSQSETQVPPKTTDFTSHTVDAQRKQQPLISTFPTLQTLPMDENTHNLDEQFQQLNFGKPAVENKSTRGPKESENLNAESGFYKYPSPLGALNKESKSPRHVSTVSPPQKQALEATYPTGTKTSNTARKKSVPTQDISLYENLDILTEVGNSERGRFIGDRKSYNIPGSSSHHYSPEGSDYVKLKDIPGHPAGNIPIISPRVKVLPPDEQISKTPYRMPQEHNSGGISPPNSAVRSPSSQTRGEETEIKNKPFLQPSVGRVPQENAMKPEIRTVPSNVAPSSTGTRPKQVVQKSSLGNSQICPVCGQNFVNISMENFQMHVFHCMDNDSEECMTLRNVTPPLRNVSPPLRNVSPQQTSEKDVRICPMCDASYPAELQSEFERHVQEHFGEEPIADRFEVLRP
ncbi:uncharacterized protein LOC133186854 [Saccostrea echinata]|uniref:uncharacterized protein LOC133186854 n=1 Tax=Saccostrea echinata TaxID=191078 RepID=UPI002A81E933|nr:uncharacterized protein LOC133186854 [Saccostrea echinata]